MSILVSVIIPVYNVEKFLPICVESVLCQTYKNLEIILVDDGSPDNCPKMCDFYAERDKRIRVIHKLNGGQGKARNVALDICHGDFVTFLDSDDYWEMDFIETLLNIQNRTNGDIVICNYNHVNEEGVRISGSPKTKIIEKEYTGIEAMQVALYWNEFGVAPWAKLFKTELWKTIRYKEDRIYEDLPTTYLIYHSAKKVVFSNCYKMNYRIRQNSDIHQKFNLKKVRILDSADEILEYCKNYVPECLDAAKSREVASACFILFRIPKNEINDFQDVVERCKYIICKYRFGVVLDKKARLKTRGGALLSYLGFGFERFIFDLMND